MKTYSTAEVARKIGVHKQTLLRWLLERKLAEPKRFSQGGVQVRIWTDWDVDRARRFKGTLRPGPKPKKRKGAK